MSNLTRFLAAGATAALLVFGAAPAHAVSPTNDSVSGSGSYHYSGGGQTLDADFSIDVSGGINGENPTGTASARRYYSRSATTVTSGPVLCMRVSGNVAQVIFRNDARTDLTKTPFEFSEAPLTPNFVVYMEDNPGTLDDHVNVTGYGPSTCSPPIAQVARLGTVTSGSVTVVDATPPVDTDGDGVEDGSDNCSNVANAGQADADGDDIGDRLRLGQRQRRCRLERRVPDDEWRRRRVPGGGQPRGDQDRCAGVHERRAA